MIPINDLSRSNDFDEPFFLKLRELIQSGQFLNGKQTRSLEETLMSTIGADFAIAVASGTAALSLALNALSLPDASGVILAANAGGYGRIAINQNRLTPIYVDVDVNGLLSLEKLEQSISNSPHPIRAIIVTHLYGQSVDLVEIKNFAVKKNIMLIEDCAQSIGAKISGHMAGSLGDIATFSFYPTKNLGGIGDSGALVTSDANLARKIRSLKQYGWNNKYSVEINHGDNLRIDEIQALSLNLRIKQLDSKNLLRRKIWQEFNNSAKKSGLRMVGANDESFVAHLGILDCLSNRQMVKDHLNNSGISTDIHYPIPDHKQIAWADKTIYLPETERQAQDFLTIPLFPELSKSEISQICQAIEEIESLR